jgi:hypothetical protein
MPALCERLSPELAQDADLLERTADPFLRSSRVVALLPAYEAREERVTFRRRDGRVLPVAREEQAYSTPDLLALERRLVNTAVGAGDAGAGQATRAAVRRAVAARPSLSGEQRTMIERLCLSGERISVVAGKAGKPEEAVPAYSARGGFMSPKPRRRRVNSSWRTGTPRRQARTS